MTIITGFSSRLSLTLLALLMLLLLEACDFGAPGNTLCELRSRAVIKPLTASNQTTVFESPGSLIVYHGSGCSVSKKAGTQDVITVKGSMTLPAYATQATVFLNGWDMQYLSEDHHVAGLGTIIDSIRIDKNTLTWRATGIISDKNFDDSYQWCYHYTIIAWNPTSINLIADHQDGGCDYKPTAAGASNFYATDNRGTSSALAIFPSFLVNPAFAPNKAVAILPRGFGFAWQGSVADPDHHLLQLAYSLNASEVFVENGKSYKKMGGEFTPSLPASASRVGAGYVSWETAVIFKDNDTRRDYQFGHMVSGLGGTDLGLIDPPFSSLPINGVSPGAVLGGNGQVRKQPFTITNIPYNFALPVLTGWELSYGTNDQHVRECGIWIDNIHYQKDPAATTGTLTYDLFSTLRDDDALPDFSNRHKVTILGFNAPIKSRTSLSNNPHPYVAYRVAPNPAATAISVQFDRVDSLEALPDQVELLSEKSTTPVESILIKEVYARKAFKVGNRLEFDTRGLPRGTYYVRIMNRRRRDKPVETIRVLLE